MTERANETLNLNNVAYTDRVNGTSEIAGFEISNRESEGIAAAVNPNSVAAIAEAEFIEELIMRPIKKPEPFEEL